MSCHEGACCDPIQHATDPTNCGCKGPVPQGQFCVQGSACTVEQHMGDALNCGCHGPCAGGEWCVSGQCVCNPEQNKQNTQNCACGGPCQANLEVCANGKCVCDPSKNLENPDNCACKGACPSGQVCAQGRCGCPEGTVMCKGVCEPKETASCLCNLSQHLADKDNCGCEGPCGSDQACKNAKCVCDPVYHGEDSQNCGCTGQQCKDGQICQAGQCVCPGGQVYCAPPGKVAMCQASECCDPAVHQSDDANCGCNGPCPDGMGCSFGACSQCEPLKNLQNSANCGCTGACKGDEICQNGQCICKPGLNPCFAKVGPFAGKTVCQPVPASQLCADCLKECDGGTNCETKPGMTIADYSTTGQAVFQCCPPGGCCKDKCQNQSSCVDGSCQCNKGFSPCMSGKGQLSCIAEINAKHICPDCMTACPDGKCVPTSSGGHACCTEKPDGSTVCCSTQEDGTNKCCNSAAGQPNACL